MVISEKDILRLQLFNVVVDRSEMAVSQSETKLESAKMAIIITSRDLTKAKADLAEYSDYLRDTYEINFETDQVDWKTGEITRGEESGDKEETPDEGGVATPD